MAREYKIVFVGSMGSGKTTAIRNISDAAPAACERALVDLVHTSSGIEAALLATPDRFAAVSATRAQRLDGARLAAMSS